MERMCKLAYRAITDVPMLAEEVSAKSLWLSRPTAGSPSVSGDLVRIEFLKSALKPKTFYSIGPNEETPLQIFQLLWKVSPVSKMVRHAVCELPGALKVGLVRYAAHRLPQGILPLSFDAFSVGEVGILDFMRFASWATLREMRQWSAGAGSSEIVHGCLCLCNPERCSDVILRGCKLTSASMPLLLLLELLRSRGWILTSADVACVSLTTSMPSVFPGRC